MNYCEATLRLLSNCKSSSPWFWLALLPTVLNKAMSNKRLNLVQACGHGIDQINGIQLIQAVTYHSCYAKLSFQTKKLVKWHKTPPQKIGVTVYNIMVDDSLEPISWFPRSTGDQRVRDAEGSRIQRESDQPTTEHQCCAETPGEVSHR